MDESPSSPSLPRKRLKKVNWDSPETPSSVPEETQNYEDSPEPPTTKKMKISEHKNKVF
jgi:hypothetical protein